MQKGSETPEHAMDHQLPTDCNCEHLLKVVIVSVWVQDSGTAKALAFHKEVATRCITLDGDDFNPGGLLTGFPFLLLICLQSTHEAQSMSAQSHVSGNCIGTH